MHDMFKDFRFVHFMASHRTNKKYAVILRHASVNITYLLHLTPIGRLRVLLRQYVAFWILHLDSFINIWMPHERNITTWREQKGADSPPVEENISFVSSTLLNGGTSCWIFSPFFLLSDAMLIFHSQIPSTSSTGYTWHVVLRIILHHLRKKSQAVNMLMPLQMSKRIQPGLSRSASSCHMTFQHPLDL